MRSSAHRLSLVLVSMVALLLAGTSLARAQAVAPAPGDAASAPATPQPARWAQRKLSFTYSGFTTHYSCDGLVEKVRQVLLDLGARRSDLKVHEASCGPRLGAPTPFPSVAGTFSVLEPVPAAEAYSPNGTGGVVFAHWQPVKLRLAGPDLDMSANCELLDQVKQHILPLFPARNVAFSSNCFPHELTAGSSLRVEVLMPVKGNTSPTRNESAPTGRTSEPAQAAN